jgi:membrane-bound lytic murein transglycosylase B
MDAKRRSEAQKRTKSASSSLATSFIAPPLGSLPAPARATLRTLRVRGLLRRSPGKAGLRYFVAVISLAVAGTAAAAPPPNAPVPGTGPAVAAALTRTDAELRRAIGGWLKSARRSPVPPLEVALNALFEQRIYRFLARNDRVAGATYRRLARPLAAAARDVVVAHRELFRITPPIPARRIRTGPAPRPAALLGYYREGERRFGVSWRVLAAVNFVESAFGKLRSRSAAGAQGPMQFMPATWRVYGLGGDVHDPHDAILGAANYLHASGAPRNLRHALYAYNPHPAYVDAVLRYERRMRADRHAFYGLYSWQVFVRTPRGDVRVTGAGR